MNMAKIPATPYAKKLALEKGIDLQDITPTGRFGEIKARDIINHKGGKRVKITPLAKRIAEDLQIDLEKIQGSGYAGKIMKEDVLAQAGKARETTPAAAAAPVQDGDRAVPMSGMRKVIGRRMSQSHQEIPPVTLNAKANVTELLDMRKKVNAKLEEKISINDFVLKAVCIGLKEYPYVNAVLGEDAIIYKKDVHLGVAVALDDGLLVPNIKNADTLSLKELSKQAKTLAVKARDGKLMPDEYQNGTFTVSNLGMYDIVSFTPIVNQPEAGILGVCAIEDELALQDGAVVSKKMMGLSFTFDHRVMDGAMGALFLKRIKELLENPLEMLIG